MISCLFGGAALTLDRFSGQLEEIKRALISNGKVIPTEAGETL